jgi:hypothetical protein
MLQMSEKSIKLQVRSIVFDEFSHTFGSGSQLSPGKKDMWLR